jgi:hypothetical protein
MNTLLAGTYIYIYICIHIFIYIYIYIYIYIHTNTCQFIHVYKYIGMDTLLAGTGAAGEEDGDEVHTHTFM